MATISRYVKSAFGLATVFFESFTHVSLQFKPSFLARGEAGGYEVAAYLREALINCVRHQMTDLDADLKVIVRMYADLKQLGETFCNAGFITSPSAIDDFARGFAGYHSLFEIIDIGKCRISLTRRMQGMT